MEEDPAKPKKYHYVYEITNIYNGMRYIGARSCKCLPKDDIKYMSSSRQLKKAIKEEGLDHFVKTILQEFPERELALNYEIQLHQDFDVGWNPLFYNMVKQTSTKFDASTLTGPNNYMYGKHHSEETKQKIGKANKGRYVGEKSTLYGKPKTEEAKAKLSKAMLGKPSRFKGKHHTEEAKKKLSEALTGRFSGDKNPMYGKHWSEEEKLNQSIKLKGKYAGENSPNYGKPQREETKQKISIANTGRFVGEKSYMYGIPKSEEIRKQISETKITRGSNAGVRNGRALLTPEKVLEIRKLYKEGWTFAEIARKYNIEHTTATRAAKGLSWKSVPEESTPTPIDPDWQKNYCC